MTGSLFLLVCATTATARIGASLEECVERYGNSLAKSNSGKPSAIRFKKSDFTIDVALEDGQVTEISYRKEAAPFRASRLAKMKLAEWISLFGESVPLLTSEAGAVLHRFRSGAVVIEAWFQNEHPTSRIRYLSPPGSQPVQVPKYLIAENLQTWETEFGTGRLVQERDTGKLYEWSKNGVTIQAWFRNGKQHGWPLSFNQSELSEKLVDSLLDRSVFTAAERETLIKNNIRANVVEHVEEADGITRSYAVNGSERLVIAMFDPKKNTLVIRTPDTVSTETVSEEADTEIKDL